MFHRFHCMYSVKFSLYRLYHTVCPKLEYLQLMFVDQTLRCFNPCKWAKNLLLKMLPVWVPGIKTTGASLSFLLTSLVVSLIAKHVDKCAMFVCPATSKILAFSEHVPPKAILWLWYGKFRSPPVFYIPRGVLNYINLFTLRYSQP